MQRILRFSNGIGEKCLRSNLFAKMNQGTLQRRIDTLCPKMKLGSKLGLGLGMSLGFGYSWALTETDDMDHAYKGMKLHRGQVSELNDDMRSILPPTRNLFNDLEKISKLFVEKVDVGEEAMSDKQFFRWIQFYAQKNLSEESRAQWKAAFNMDSLITLSEFRMGYCFIRTMLSKKLKKRDLPKWSKVNFAAMDMGQAGSLDFEDVTFWIGFAVRTGYINNRHPTGKEMTDEEVADLTFEKYDDDGDRSIDEKEFQQIFKDLLCGTFAKWVKSSDVVYHSPEMTTTKISTE